MGRTLRPNQLLDLGGAGSYLEDRRDASGRKLTTLFVPLRTLPVEKEAAGVNPARLSEDDGDFHRVTLAKAKPVAPDIGAIEGLHIAG